VKVFGLRKNPRATTEDIDGLHGDSNTLSYRIIFFVSSATAPCVALPPASLQSFVFSVVNDFIGLIKYNTFTVSGAWEPAMAVP